MISACVFTNSGSAPCAIVSAAKVSSLSGLCHLAGGVTHFLVRADARVTHRQIKNVHLCDQGNMDIADFHAKSLFLQITHDTARSIEAKGAPAAQNGSMDPLCRRYRIEDAGFPRRGTAPSDVQACAHSLRVFTEKDCDPGTAGFVFCLSDPYPGKRIQGDLYYIHFLFPPF